MYTTCRHARAHSSVTEGCYMNRIRTLPITLLRLAMLGGAVATVLFVLDALLLDHGEEA